MTMKTEMKLEICCYTVESAELAEEGGADRIELCDNYPEGGTTPSHGAVRLALERLKIPVNVMVRPRGGDFLYTDEEYEIMRRDLQHIRELGANGIVTGFLKADGEIDLDRTREMVGLAHPMEVTFHRAFDMCRDPHTALEELKDTGVSRVLTSGGRPTVTEGSDLLAELVEAAGDDIIVMPGCGVNPETLGPLAEKTGAREYHSAAQAFRKSGMQHRNPNVSMGGIEGVDEYGIVTVNPELVRAMAGILKGGQLSL